MRGALSYLTVIKLKNQIKDMLKSPARLLYAVLLVALLVFTAVSGGSEDMGAVLRDRGELQAIVFAFFTMMFVMVFSTAYGQGSSMFTLSDVNLVFPTPINPPKVLFYGLFRQLGTSFILGFFLLFQYSWMHNVYGIDVAGLVAIIIGYGFTIFLAQFTAMALFCYTSHSHTAKRTVRLVIYGLVLLLVLGAVAYVFPSLQGTDFLALLPKAVEFTTLPIVSSFPVTGWIHAIYLSLSAGNWAMVAVYAGALALFTALLTIFIIKSKNNFYEDVIQGAETQQSAITAKKEGQIGEVVGKNVRLGKVGLDKGEGAGVLYYKHMTENRRSGIFLISNMSLLFAAIIIFTSFFMRDAGIFAPFAMGTYMQIFSVSLGRFSRELSKPYIYLIPEPPVKKLYYAVKESLFENTIEAILIFVPVALIVGASPIDAALCILVRISFSLLFTAGNLAVERVFGGVRSRALIMFFYILVLLLMILPGAALASVLTFGLNLSFLTEFTVPFLSLIAANIPVSLLVMYMCRNLLQYAELNNR